MCKRAVERDMGDGTKLGQKQTIQNWIAESRAEINAARYMVLHAAIKWIKKEQKRQAMKYPPLNFLLLIF